MSGNTAVITGAATGIGMGLARKLDACGWTVFASFNRRPPDELQQGASDRLTVLRMDIADDEQVAAAAETVRQALDGRGLRLLINNAAMTGAPGPVETVNIAEFKHLMDVNFWGPLRVTQAFLPLLRQHARARIIMVTSTSVYLTIPMGCSYPASKHALTALSEHLRMEMAPFGIEVTLLEPGGVETPMVAFREEEETYLWESIPDPLRQQYGEAFNYPGKGLQEGFKFESTESYAEKVYKQIIMARKLRPRYTLGKGVAVLPWMHRLLSKRALERFFARLMQVKKKG
jgi:NAD(P)-dependent dehydrogenase (short-subunit alcohol dehydrogenase family)